MVLAKVELRRGEPKLALAALDNPKYGPLKLIGQQEEPIDGYKSELYAAELQSVVGVMTTDGSDVPAMMKRASETMERLQTSVKDKENASDRLVKIYLGLARDIRVQLDSATPEKKSKLVSAFRVFLDSIAGSSQDPATLQWVGQTLMHMGETSMVPGQVRAQGQAKELLTFSDLSITEICLAVGFQSLGSFSDLFRRHVGHSPSVHRLRALEQKRLLYRSAPGCLLTMFGITSPPIDPGNLTR